MELVQHARGWVVTSQWQMATLQLAAQEGSSLSAATQAVALVTRRPKRLFRFFIAFLNVFCYNTVICTVPGIVENPWEFRVERFVAQNRVYADGVCGFVALPKVKAKSKMSYLRVKQWKQDHEPMQMCTWFSTVL